MKINWLDNFIKRWRLRLARHPTAPTLDRETLRQMVRGIATTRPDEIGCDECFERVDQFAEMVLAGKDAAEALPLVQDHLARCRDCREEFEALLDALRALAH